MYLFKKYVDTNKENVKIKMTISFNKQSISWATGNSIDIGYRVTVIPVEIDKKDNYHTESFGAFTGFNDTLIAINRQSKKRLESAIDVLDKNMDKYLQYFKDRGITFPELEKPLDENNN